MKNVPGVTMKVSEEYGATGKVATVLSFISIRKGRGSLRITFSDGAKNFFRIRTEQWSILFSLHTSKRKRGNAFNYIKFLVLRP